MGRIVFNSLVLVLFLVAGAGVAEAKKASIEGQWSGGGTVKLKTGEVEKVRCKIKYEKGSGRTFEVYVNCSHANGTFQQTGRLVQLKANKYSGRLYSDELHVAGDVSVTVSGNNQSIYARSDKGSAKLALKRR